MGTQRNATDVFVQGFPSKEPDPDFDFETFAEEFDPESVSQTGQKWMSEPYIKYYCDTLPEKISSINLQVDSATRNLKTRAKTLKEEFTKEYYEYTRAALVRLFRVRMAQYLLQKKWDAMSEEEREEDRQRAAAEKEEHERWMREWEEKERERYSYVPQTDPFAPRLTPMYTRPPSRPFGMTREQLLFHKLLIAWLQYGGENRDSVPLVELEELICYPVDLLREINGQREVDEDDPVLLNTIVTLKVNPYWLFDDTCFPANFTTESVKELHETYPNGWQNAWPLFVPSIVVAEWMGDGCPTETDIEEWAEALRDDYFDRKNELDNDENK